MEKSSKDGKLWNYGLLQYWVTPILSTIPSPLEALTGRKLRTSLPQIPLTIGKSVESSRICQNSSNINIHPVLPPAVTAWNLNQDSLYSSRKYMGTSGKLESLTSQPRSLVPTGSSFQTVPSWEGPTRGSNPDHYFLISSWKVKPKRGTHQNSSPKVHSSISDQCSQDWSIQHYQQAIQLHQSWVNKGHCPQGKTFLPVPLVWHSLPSQWGDQPILPKVFHQGDSLHPGLKLFCVVELSVRCFIFKQ